LGKAINELEDQKLKDKLLTKFNKKNPGKKNKEEVVEIADPFNLTEIELASQLKIVDVLIRNKKDQSRFMAGWRQVDEKIKDKNAEAKLRTSIVDRFVESKETNAKD